MTDLTSARKFPGKTWYPQVNFVNKLSNLQQTFCHWIDNICHLWRSRCIRWCIEERHRCHLECLPNCWVVWDMLTWLVVAWVDRIARIYFLCKSRSCRFRPTPWRHRCYWECRWSLRWFLSGTRHQVLVHCIASILIPWRNKFCRSCKWKQHRCCLEDPGNKMTLSKWVTTIFVVFSTGHPSEIAFGYPSATAFSVRR